MTTLIKTTKILTTAKKLDGRRRLCGKDGYLKAKSVAVHDDIDNKNYKDTNNGKKKLDGWKRYDYVWKKANSVCCYVVDVHYSMYVFERDYCLLWKFFDGHGWYSYY